MKQNVKDRTEGKSRAIKGKIKESVGKALGKKSLEDQGRNEKISGKVQKKIGDVEKVFEV